MVTYMNNTENNSPITRTDERGNVHVFWMDTDGREWEVRGLRFFDTEGREFATDGAVSQEGAKKIKECKRCGVPVVEVTSRRTGNDYKVEISRSHGGYWFYMKHNVHKCHETNLANFKAEKEAVALWAKLNDRLCVGAPVVVAKGRKFPVGTEGVVIWLATEADAYGNFKAGVKKDDGEVMWINSDNIVRNDKEA